MNRVIGLQIDRDVRDDKEFYRFHIDYEDGGSHGSCFCYESFEEAYERVEEVIVRHYE